MRFGGGLEEDWRRIGGGLEEDWRMCRYMFDRFKIDVPQLCYRFPIDVRGLDEDLKTG